MASSASKSSSCLEDEHLLEEMEQVLSLAASPMPGEAEFLFSFRRTQLGMRCAQAAGGDHGAVGNLKAVLARLRNS